jgi:O-antigen/teichoic acid export membrane protein
VRLGSGTAWAVAMQLVTAVTSVLVGIIVARTLGPDGKGTLSIIQQVVAVLLVLGDLGVALSAVYYISKAEIPAGTVLGNALAALGAVSAVAFVALAVLFLSPVAVVSLSWTYVLAAFALFVASLTLSWLGSIAMGLHGVGGQARAAMLASVVTLLLVVAAWLLGFRSPLAVIVSTVAGSVAGCALALTSLRGEIGRVRASFSAFRRMVRHSLRLYVGSAADYLHFRQDILLLGWMSSVGSAGIYSVGVSVAEIASRLPAAMGSAIQAKASRVSHESALEFSARAIRLTVVLAVVVVGTLAALAGWLIPLLFGAAFAGAVDVVYLLVPGILANALIWPISSYQSARGQVYWGISFVSVVLNVALNLALISAWDYRGAAVASSISYVVLLGGLLLRLRRDTELGLSAFLVPRREDLEILSASVRAYLRRG